MRKFRNEPTTLDGIAFASRKEAARYAQLKLLQRAGEIAGLEVQPKFPMVVNSQKVCSYIADFAYLRGSDGQKVVEDVKSSATRSLPVYRLKRKLLKAIHGLDVVEV